MLGRLLRAEDLAGYEVVGLSGTSGGAVCALLAWHNLLRADAARAVEDLDAFWRDNSATAPLEQILNYWTVWAGNLQNFVGIPAISPYDNYFSVLGLEEFRRLLERRVDFRNVSAQPAGSYPGSWLGPWTCSPASFGPSTADETKSPPRPSSLRPQSLHSSAPCASRTGGPIGTGSSRRTPVRELTDERPDEIWVIQINPKERESERGRSPR